jgi:hypothetical protein
MKYAPDEASSSLESRHNKKFPPWINFILPLRKFPGENEINKLAGPCVLSLREIREVAANNRRTSKRQLSKARAPSSRDSSPGPDDDDVDVFGGAPKWIFHYGGDGIP